MDTRRNNGTKHDKLRKLDTISQADLPNGRKGKHHPMLLDVLEALTLLAEKRAIKFPLADYPGSVADIRSAIHRATKKLDLEVETSSDDDFFYVWKSNGNGASR